MSRFFSIIILTKNSLGVVERLLESLRNQDFPHELEWIFMDNSSTDGTAAYLESLALGRKKIVNVPEGRFSHSGTRLQAAREAAGEILFFFTDDILPQGRGFLASLAAPLLAGRAAAAYGVHQIDPLRHDPVDAYLHNNWHLNHDDLVGPLAASCWSLLSPQQRRKLSNFDNCASCIKRDVLLETGFRPVPYGEDMLFARDLVCGGHSVALAREALFYHWHRVSFSYFFKRMLIDQHLSIETFGIYYVPGLYGTLKAIALRILHRAYLAFFKVRMPFFKKFYWSFYNARVLSADFLGKYSGTLNEADCRHGLVFIKKRLFKLKQRIIADIEKKSILRY